MDTSQQVSDCAGGAWAASLNHYQEGSLGAVTTVQIDALVYVVGSTSFVVTRYSLDDWLASPGGGTALSIDCDDAAQAWELLRLVREDCLVWQCGACDAWIYTSNRPRVGIVGCSTCGEGGVDFRHADRHVGGET